jgi:hypothetical protein
MITRLVDGGVSPPLLVSSEQWQKTRSRRCNLSSVDVDIAAEVLIIVREQLEYYFSDANMKNDEFLRGLRDADRFVTFDQLSDFPRLQALTTDPDVMIGAVEGSETLELNSSQTAIRRCTPFVERFDAPLPGESQVVKKQNLLSAGANAFTPTAAP